MLLICTATHGENLRLCQRALERARHLNLDAQLLDISTINLPLYTSFDDAAPDPSIINPLMEVFTKAKGFFIAAPEYNGSIPPTLVNAITWLSVEGEDFRQMFNNKPAIIATHSGGSGQKVLLAMRMQLSHLGVNVLGRELSAKDGVEVRDASIDDVLKRIAPLLR